MKKQASPALHSVEQGKDKGNDKNIISQIKSLLDDKSKNNYEEIIKLTTELKFNAIKNQIVKEICNRYKYNFRDVIEDIYNLELQSKAQKIKQDSIELLKKAIKSSTDIINSNEELQYIVENIIPLNSVILLTGKRSSMKSLLSLYLSICISSRNEFINKRVNSNHEVIYFDLENSLQLIRNRLKLLNYENKDLSNIKFILKRDIISLDIETQFNEICEICKDKVVIFDTLSKIHTKDENNNSQMTQIMSKLVTLAQNYSLCVILLHHHRKPNTLSNTMNTRGASVIEDNADVIFEIEKKNLVKENSSILQLNCTKHRYKREDNLTQQIEISFEEDKILINSYIDESDKFELEYFVNILKFEYEKDRSNFDTQNKLINLLVSKYNYSREKAKELLHKSENSNLIKFTRSKNNSKSYYFLAS